MPKYDLDTPLVSFKNRKGLLLDWTVRNAVEGVQIFGGIGSGKTSGSGRLLALKYLQAGFGGLVLTVKPDEKDLWEKYCLMAGRAKDLLIVGPGNKNYFNFLDYEGAGKDITENIVQVLKTVIRAGEEKDMGTSDGGFWETSLDMLLFNVIDLCKLAYGRVPIVEMYDIVQSLPKPGTTYDKMAPPTTFQNAFSLARQNVQRQVDEWKQERTQDELKKLHAEQKYEAALCEHIDDARTLRYIDQFFAETFMNLGEKTRSIIDFSFTGFLSRLLRDPVYSLFCHQPSNFTPEDCLRGKIIVIDLPVKIYHKIGRDSQVMFKYIWQRAMERIKSTEERVPVFLWADEAQHFLHEHDVECQATARSSRIATVYLSQNLPNYHANMGGSKSDYRVQSFLGTLATKIFHANADIETNRYASDLFGDTGYENISNTSTAAGQFSSSRTKSLIIDKLVRPEHFSTLRTGGELQNFKVSAYLHVQSNLQAFGNEQPKVHFDQNYQP